MIRLLADENLDNTIIRGLLRRNPDIDIATTTVYVGANGRSPLQPCPILN